VHRVILISGARTESDVMRGEETELVGFFSLPVGACLAEYGLIIKPGTHSKHLRVDHGRLTRFQTFMSGELFDVLSKHSILQHSLEARQDATTEAGGMEDLAALRAGVRQALVAPLPSALFRVRTRQLLDGMPGESNRAFLSGVLLGAELGYLKGAEFSEVRLALCATGPLAQQYVAALEELGLGDRVTVIPPAETEMLSARGQAVIWRQIEAARLLAE
jgi:2-dehydro-3-deoxygalactonokinase